MGPLITYQDVAAPAFATVHVNGQIGTDFDVPAFIKELMELPDSVQDLTVYINSPGGTVEPAIAMHDALKAWDGHVYVIIEKVAMGSGALVAMAGDEVRMKCDAIFTILAPRYILYSPEPAKQQKLNDLRLQVIDRFAARALMDREELVHALDVTTHFAGAAAKEAGFVDDVFGEAA